jgi:16S rRNA (guanine966-N2)-methyltransferase
MSEKVRGALFNVLGDIEGLMVLDAYSGSGALAFECISRGAKHVTMVENDKTAINAILTSVDNLGLNDVIELHRSSLNVWTKRNNEMTYDLIICDPPYNDVRRDHLEALAGLLSSTGVIVYSVPNDVKLRLPRQQYSLVDRKQYGPTASLVFYRRIS